MELNLAAWIVGVLAGFYCIISPVLCMPVAVDYYKYPDVSCMDYDIRNGDNVPTTEQCREHCSANEACMGFQFRPWGHTNNCLIRGSCKMMDKSEEGWMVYRKKQESYTSHPNRTCTDGPPASELNVATQRQCRDTCEVLSSCMAFEYRDYKLGYNCLQLQQCDVLTNSQEWDTYWSDRVDATKHFRDVCCLSYGPYGGDGGKKFSDRNVTVEADGPITQIHLMEGQYIQSLSFTYGTNGTTKNHGSIVESYGTKDLQEGERIIGVYGNQGIFLDKLGFITNFRKIGPFGFGEAMPFNVTGDGRSLKYISGRAGDMLDRVVFHFCCDNYYLWPEP